MIAAVLAARHTPQFGTAATVRCELAKAIVMLWLGCWLRHAYAVVAAVGEGPCPGCSAGAGAWPGGSHNQQPRTCHDRRGGCYTLPQLASEWHCCILLQCTLGFEYAAGERLFTSAPGAQVALNSRQYQRVVGSAAASQIIMICYDNTLHAIPLFFLVLHTGG
jgi:hypothetical protein